MPKTSGFLAQIEQEKIKAMRIARHLELAFCCDILCITLGRMGYGEKRLKDVEKMFSPIVAEYRKARIRRSEMTKGEDGLKRLVLRNGL